MFKRERRKRLDFQLKISAAKGQTTVQFTCDLWAYSATEAIESIYDTIAGQKVIRIGSQVQGKSIVVPVDALVSIECNFVKETDA